MQPNIVGAMPWSPWFKVDHEKRMVSLIAENPSDPLRDLLNDARAKMRFQELKGWRDEQYPIVGAYKITMERAGSALFGIVTLGVHMTAYTRTSKGMMIWVPRRSPTKSTYPAMLDNSVAGGISAGETPLRSLIREAAEEASLSNDTVRDGAIACGTVSYFHIRDSRGGGETALLQPEVQYVYDLELPEDAVLKPSDDEVQEFYLWNVQQVQMAMAEGQFKPNCALVLLDFFIRHGILTAESEKHYVHINSRLHRNLPFPMELWPED